jgi:hypothetical protein
VILKALASVIILSMIIFLLKLCLMLIKEQIGKEKDNLFPWGNADDFF